ncbi:MAG TPA: hypothetical protein VNA25_09065 [Phycisphaerae bacterium]|nr:hypothetical protein [Phycisphaerae bacterium]
MPGGAGKASFVNGRNYPPTQKKPDPEHGSWRVEVPIQSTTLVVLHAQCKGAPLPSPLKAENVAGSTVVHVPLGDLDYRVVLAEGADSLPWVEVRQDGMLVEKLVLTPPPAGGR